jgi:hypothetical protein
MNISKIIEETIRDINLLEKNDIPNIDLYMDQVTTFMEKHLSNTKRFEDDKVLTKTMINNYTKNDLIPPPDKKKYSKEHVLLLTLIYYFKNIMSINDIKKLLAPISEKYFQNDKGMDLTDVYEAIIDLETPTIGSTTKDMEDKLNIAMNAFEDLPKREADYLRTYAFVSLLSFDIYLKKQVIESIIDSLDEPISKEEREKLAKKAKEEKEKAIKKAAKEASKEAK